jgi:hypothetical protein
MNTNYTTTQKGTSETGRVKGHVLCTGRNISVHVAFCKVGSASCGNSNTHINIPHAAGWEKLALFLGSIKWGVIMCCYRWALVSFAPGYATIVNLSPNPA